MEVIIAKGFMQVLIWILRLLDGVFNFFQVLAGINPIRADGKEKDLLEYFLEADAITRAFWYILTISIFVAAVCMVAGIVKSVINLKGGERRPLARIAGQGMSTVIVSLAMAAILIAGITVSNQVLQLVNESFTDGKQVSMSARIFEFSVEAGYEMVLMPIMKEVTVPNPETGEDMIVNVPTEDYYLEYALDEDGNKIPGDGWYLKKDGTLYSVADINFSDTSKPLDNADTILGEFKMVNILGTDLFPVSNTPAKKGTAKVKLDAFNFIVAYFAALVLIVTVSIACFGLVKRLYDIILLFLSLPLISATIPLDDGAKFQLWRETVMSKVLLAYGTVIAVNVFVLAMPLILNLVIVDGFMNNVFQLFLMIGGALSISGGQLLFARLLGTSAEENREVMQGLRTIIGGAVAVGGMSRAAKNAVFGGRDKYGVQHQGAFKTAALGAGKATNVAGNVLGGNAYRSVASSIVSKTSGLHQALAGFSSVRTSEPPQSYSNSGGSSGGYDGALSGASEKKGFMEKGGLIGITASAAKGAVDSKKTQKNKDLARVAYEQSEKGVVVVPKNVKDKRGKK